MLRKMMIVAIPAGLLAIAFLAMPKDSSSSASPVKMLSKSESTQIALVAPTFPQKVQPIKVQPIKVQPTKVLPSKVLPSKVYPVKVYPVKVQPTKVYPTKVQPARIYPFRIQPTYPPRDLRQQPQPSGPVAQPKAPRQRIS
jgi:hypothetical protein